MKYLKLFERWIKHTDPIAVNHILRDFSRKIEDIIIGIKDIDNYVNWENKHTSGVKRYFHHDGLIKIFYSDRDRGNLLETTLQQENDDVAMFIHNYKMLNKDEINTSLEFFNFVQNCMSEYITNQDVNLYNGRLTLLFPIEKMNQILEDLDEFLSVNKYNL